VAFLTPWKSKTVICALKYKLKGPNGVGQDLHVKGDNKAASND